MRTLEKITISNIRKFSENVEIPIGKGATVFLAPNGTGKTAIFEAIELALTGEVKRLGHPPTALIRDNRTRSFIRLDFERGKFCEANFQLGEEPLLTGNHSELFGTIQATDVPFLLRLTHLLNQKNNEWFVQTGAQDAGAQLDHLSIGRDAAQANSLMTGAKKAATTMFEKASRKLEDAKVKEHRWNELKSKRMLDAIEIQKTLQPRPLLLNKLNATAEFINSQTLLSDEVDNLLSQARILDGLLKRLRENQQNRVVALGSLEKVVSDFIEQSEALEKGNSEYTANRESKKKIADQIAKLRGDFQSKSGEIKLNEDLLINLKGIRDFREALNRTIVDIEAINRSIAAINEEINEINKRIQKRNDDLVDAVRLSEIHASLRRRTDRLAADRAILVNNQRLIELWSNNLKRLKQLYEEQPKLIARMEQAQSQLDISQENYKNALESLLSAQEKFDSVNSMSDTIKEAIGHIASHLPLGTKDCPLCLHEYEEGELATRITRALEAINPFLKDAAEALEIEKDKVRALETDLDSKSKIFQAALGDRNRNEALINELENVNASQFVFKIYDAHSIDEAIELSGEASIRIDSLEKELFGERSTQRAEIPIDPIRAELTQLTEQLETLTRQLTSNERELEAKQKAKEVGDEKLNESEAILNIYSSIAQQELIVNSLKEQLEKMRKDQEDSQRVLAQTNEILIRDEDNLAKIATRLRELRAKWTEQGLSGDPSADPLRAEITKVQSNIADINNRLVDIDKTLQEVIKWRSVESSLNVERDLTNFRGQYSEAEFDELVKGEVAATQAHLAFLEARNTALLSFAKNIAKQLEDIHKQIRAINPLWKALLARIVVEPRFANTNLNSFLHYKKQHANVKVALHGEEVIASHVASEAQITDLQFTFLLAMAQTYQWSSWRALLLDDPTQHHDLVHASAVFDLLRDYIVDHNFQVLLATHDSVQANFFVRKLENDGIPTKLYKLVSGANGVTAEIH